MELIFLIENVGGDLLQVLSRSRFLIIILGYYFYQAFNYKAKNHSGSGFHLIVQSLMNHKITFIEKYIYLNDSNSIFQYSNFIG